MMHRDEIERIVLEELAASGDEVAREAARRAQADNEADDKVVHEIERRTGRRAWDE